MLLSWSTYHFFKDSPAIKDAIENQLKIRQFDIQNIKDKVKDELKKESPANISQDSKTGTKKLQKSIPTKTITPKEAENPSEESGS